MNIYEKIKKMNIEKLTNRIDKYGQFDDSPWIKKKKKTYCKNCESIKSRSKQYNTETSYAYCELHDNCKFFPDIEYIPDNKDIIRMWLESEMRNNNDGKNI